MSFAVRAVTFPLNLAGIRAILRDERRYGPDTSMFKPERFLKDGQLDPDIQDPSSFVFGYGRRFVKIPSSHKCLNNAISHKSSYVPGLAQEVI